MPPLSQSHRFPRLLIYSPSGAATDLGLRASLIEKHTPPEILVHGLVTPTDVEKLFSMYVRSSTYLEHSMTSNVPDR